VADEIPFDQLPPFLQGLLSPDPIRDNPSFSWTAPRPPVTMPKPDVEPWQPPVEPVRTVAPARPSPRVPARRMPSARPLPSRQGRLL
jgi:hypothetical protein